LDAVPGPFGPGAVQPVGGLAGDGVRALDVRDGHLVRRRVALVVVPDVELAVAFEGDPLAGTRQRRHATGVGNRGALAGLTRPAPVVERAGDLVALDLTHAQVAAHEIGRAPCREKV